eukprot:11128709-Alexandrium_andersonii.AAC.1
MASEVSSKGVPEVDWVLGLPELPAADGDVAVIRDDVERRLVLGTADVLGVLGKAVVFKHRLRCLWPGPERPVPEGSDPLGVRWRQTDSTGRWRSRDTLTRAAR